MKNINLLICVIFIMGCELDDEAIFEPDQPTTTKPEEQTEVRSKPVTKDDVTNEEGDKISYAEIAICSVTARFVFGGEKADQVDFNNNNDATVIVVIENFTTGGTVVKNCIWPKGVDSEPITFNKSDQLQITVFKGEGDLLHYSCSAFLGEVAGTFNMCQQTTFSII